MSNGRALDSFSFLSALLKNEAHRKEVFRFVVDGKFHKTEQGFVRYENDEKHSLYNVLNATLETSKKLDRSKSIHLTAVDYKQIHALCRNGIKAIDEAIVGGKFTVNDKNIYGVRRVTKDGIMDLCKFAEKYPQLNLSVSVQTTPWDVEKLPMTPRLARYFLGKMAGAHQENYEIGFFIEVTVNEKNSEQIAEAILNELNRDLSCATSDNEIIEAIASCAYELEHLHAFKDVNLRSNIVLINSLLDYYGFPPVSYYDPNYIDGCSKAEFFDMIKQGMLRTLDIIAHPGHEFFEFKVSQLSQEHQKYYGEIIQPLVEKVASDPSDVNRIDIGALTRRIQSLKTTTPSPVLINQAKIQKKEIQDFVESYDSQRERVYLFNTPFYQQSNNYTIFNTNKAEDFSSNKKARLSLKGEEFMSFKKKEEEEKEEEELISFTTEEEQDQILIYTQAIEKFLNLHREAMLSDGKFVKQILEFGDPDSELINGSGITILNIAESVGVPPIILDTVRSTIPNYKMYK